MVYNMYSIVMKMCTKFDKKLCMWLTFFTFCLLKENSWYLSQYKLNNKFVNSSELAFERQIQRYIICIYYDVKKYWNLTMFA
jgi:hypothetical protein